MDNKTMSIDEKIWKNNNKFNTSKQKLVILNHIVENDNRIKVETFASIVG